MLTFAENTIKPLNDIIVTYSNRIFPDLTEQEVDMNNYNISRSTIDLKGFSNLFGDVTTMGKTGLRSSRLTTEELGDIGILGDRGPNLR